MSKLDVSVPHALSQDEAVQRIKTLLTEVKSQHADKFSNLREDWNGHVGQFSFSALGQPISGTVMVSPTDVRITGALPLAASFFKSRIESAIRERAADLLT